MTTVYDLRRFKPFLYILASDGRYFVCRSDEPVPITDPLSIDDALQFLRRLTLVHQMGRRR